MSKNAGDWGPLMFMCPVSEIIVALLSVAHFPLPNYRRLAAGEPNVCVNMYDVIEMCAPAAPPIMLRIRTRPLNPKP